MGQSSTMTFKFISKNTQHSGKRFRTIGPLVCITDGFKYKHGINTIAAHKWDSEERLETYLDSFKFVSYFANYISYSSLHATISHNTSLTLF